MNMFAAIKKVVRQDCGDVGDPAVALRHRDVIQGKYFLRRFYCDMYDRFCAFLPHEQNACRAVELGSGGGFFKSVMPTAITTDINPLSKSDVCFSNLSLPFKDGSVDVFLMLNVFHHCSDPELFLREMLRCLRPGGKVLMIEPANTPWRRFVDLHFHHEPFDVERDWLLKDLGPLLTANGALPWIVFCRDREVFHRKLPGFEVQLIASEVDFRYLASGGLTYRQLLPDCMYMPVYLLGRALQPLAKYIGFFLSIELVKR